MSRGARYVVRRPDRRLARRPQAAVDQFAGPPSGPACDRSYPLSMAVSAIAAWVLDCTARRYCALSPSPPLGPRDTGPAAKVRRNSSYVTSSLLTRKVPRSSQLVSSQDGRPTRLSTATLTSAVV